MYPLERLSNKTTRHHHVETIYSSSSMGALNDGTLDDKPTIRAIEDERSKLVLQRSAILKEGARRPGDKKAEKKKAETLITIVYCAIAVRKK